MNKSNQIKEANKVIKATRDKEIQHVFIVFRTICFVLTQVVPVSPSQFR